MLLDLGCKYVILGHSERRHKLGESDTFINQKVRVALAAGLDVIFCCGETLDQRKADQTEAVLDRQLIQGLAGLSADTLTRLSIAYEPVWAIGSLGHQATPQQAQEAHAVIRRRFGQMFEEKSAQALAIQYGGSVKPENAAALLSRHGVDGALIGGASLNAPVSGHRPGWDNRKPTWTCMIGDIYGEDNRPNALADVRAVLLRLPFGTQETAGG